MLDVPCGSGRHLRALGELGYSMQGVDRDSRAVEEACSGGLAASVADMRELGSLPSDFDAVICMWASFGFFEPNENRAVLGQFAARLRPGGRLVLDVYDRQFFEAHQGKRQNRGVRERRHVREGRLRTELRYPGGGGDVFEWQLYSAGELAELAGGAGLELVLACADFDEAMPAAGNQPRMQLVLER